MTTGTEGNDNLSNNPAVQNEVVDALGGNDTITIQTPTAPAPSVAVNGGAGTDTLIAFGTIRGASASGYDGQFTIRANSQLTYTVTYSSIERLELSGALFLTNSPQRMDTGEGDDILSFTPFAPGGTQGQIWTHGGNDRVTLSGAFGNASVVTGAGNDVIDLANLSSGSVGAYGGTGDDVYVVNLYFGIFEAAGEGTDEVRTARATYILDANVENLTGTSSARQVLNGNELGNRIVAGDANDTLFGNGGDDFLTGNNGIDGIHGGDGSDTVDYSREAGTLGVVVNLGATPVDPNGHPGFGRGVQPNEAIDSYGNADLLSGIENVRSGDQADWLHGSAGANRLESGGGNDYLDGGAGNDVLDGGTGADRMIGGEGDDVYMVDHAGDTTEENAGGGNDEVRSSAAAYTLGAHIESLTGLSSNGQALTGNDQSNTITGGSGNDTIDGGGGADVMIGGAGDDLYFADNEGDRVVEAAGGGNDEVRTALASYSLMGSTSVETLRGTSDAGQVLTGNDERNFIFGGAGNDRLIGMGGDDELSGGAGNDTLVGLEGFDILRGGTGDDVYAIDAGDTIIEHYDGGTDTIFTVGTIFTLMADVENLRALTDLGHLFRGNAGPNGITGGGGNELILAQDGGGDVIYTLGGDDRAYFGGEFDQYDYFDGGTGSDTLILQGNYSAGIQFGEFVQGNIFGVETIRLLSSSDNSFEGASAGPNRYSLTMRDSNAGDALTIDASGLAAGEWLALNATAETSASYTVLGGAGGDGIATGAGSDRITGGGGSDSINAGGGQDVFVYLAISDSTASAMDNLVTFSSGSDKIDLSAIDANAGTAANDAFTWIGANAFTGAAGQLRIENVGGSTWQVQGDVDGDGVADLVIQLTTGAGEAPLQGDFLF